MFTDLVGSTELFGELGDERAHALVTKHFDLITGVARQHNGRVVKNLGDGLMVVFAASQDAVHAALEMQQAVTVEGQLHPPALGLRVGLGSGEAIEDDGDFFGGPVIVASRLCGRCSPGQILATTEVAELALAQAEVAFAEAGSLALKGIADPVASCEVLPRGARGAGVTQEVARDEPHTDARPSQLALPNALRAAHDEFVGRAQELHFLGQRAATVDEGLTQLVLLAGEPGSGKSRLAAEFARLQHAEGHTVLFGRCDDEGRRFQPFAEAIELLVASETGAQVPDEWRHHVDVLAPALAIDAAEPSGDVARRAVFAAVEALLDLAAGGRRVVLVLDDLHLADRSTLALLRHLCRSATAQVMITATVRTDDLDGRPLAAMLPEFRRMDIVHELRVGDLDAAETERLIAAWAGASPTKELTDALWRRTQGNPFYTREVLRFLLASEDIITDGRHVRVAGSLQHIRLPGTVRAALDVRLRRLSPACLRMLGVASTIGDKFSLDELSILHEAVYAPQGTGEMPTLELLSEATGAGVISPLRRTTGVFRFDHGLVRQAFHDDLKSDTRAELHLALARHYESTFNDGLSTLVDIAHHYTEAASLVDRSVVASWCERAGDEAMRRLAYEDAAAEFERALDALEGGRATNGTRVRLLRRLGSSQITAGSIETGRANLRHAAAIAEANGMFDDLADIALAYVGEGVGVVLFEVGIVDGENIDLIERALEGMRPGDSSVRAKLLVHLAAASLFSADPDRHMRCADEAVAMARRVQDPATLSYVLSRASWAGWRPGETRARIDLMDECIALAHTVQDRMSEAMGEMIRQISYLELGDREGADKSRARLSSLAASSQDPYQRLYVQMLEGTQALSEGRFTEAEEIASSLLELAPERTADGGFAQPSAGVVSCYATQTAVVRLAQDRLTELRPVIEQFARDLPALPVWRVVAVFAQLLDGDPKAPARFRALALEEFPEVPRDMFFGTAATLVGECCGIVADPVIAAALYEQILPLAGLMHTHCGVTTFGSYDRSLGLLATVMGDYDLAQAHFDIAVHNNRAMQAQFPMFVTEANIAEMQIRRGGPGDHDQATALLTDLMTRAEAGGHGYALRLATTAASHLAGSATAPAVSRAARARASVRSGLRRSAAAPKTAFTRTGQFTLRSALGLAGREQAEKRIAMPSVQRLLFATMARSFRPERALGFVGELGYSLRFDDPGTPVAEWHVVVDERRARAVDGPAANPAVRVRIKATDFLQLLTGELGSITALLDGRAVIEGDYELASRMVDMFGGIPGS